VELPVRSDALLLDDEHYIGKGSISQQRSQLRSIYVIPEPTIHSVSDRTGDAVRSYVVNELLLGAREDRQSCWWSWHSHRVSQTRSSSHRVSKTQMATISPNLS